jgi:predicted Fe-Mo cluster-binding NifX family protein
MKIAAITDDGKTISQHFGRAGYYMVVSVDEGEITRREMRPKLGHNHFVQLHDPELQSGEDHLHEAGHGMDAASHDKHAQMAETIADCQVLLCRGMGQGAYLSMQQSGVRPILTDIEDIDEAVHAYLKGEIIDHTEKLH